MSTWQTMEKVSEAMQHAYSQGFHRAKAETIALLKDASMSDAEYIKFVMALNAIEPGRHDADTNAPKETR